MIRTPRLSNWISLALLGALAFSPTPADAQCNEQVFAHSTYGDSTQTYDPMNGSVDLLGSYAAPACLLALLPAGVLENTDNPQSPTNRQYPWVMDGYKAFDPANVEYALVRFDVFWDRSGSYTNDAINFFDDTTCRPAGGYGFASPLEARLKALGQNRTQWISLVIDLRTGQVFASEVDGFGVTIPGMDYGQIGTVPFNRAAVLAAAADGDLHGWVQDDIRIGYLTFYAKALAQSAETRICPFDWHLTKGVLDSGGTGSLCGSDNSYLIIDSARSDDRRRVEWRASFEVGTSNLPCSMVLEVEGNLGRRGNNINLHVLNRQTGNWDGLGTAGFPKSPRDNYTELVISNPSAYIANGVLEIRVGYTRGFGLGPFHMATDLLRLRVRRKL